MDLGEPPVLPSLRLPEALALPRPVLEVPRADLPSYKPLVVPPSDLRPPPGVKGPKTNEKPKSTPPKLPSDIRYIDVPNTDYTVPLPSNEILVTAGTTAMVSVAATLTATAVFKWTVKVLKPVFKKLLTRKKKDGEKTPHVAE